MLRQLVQGCRHSSLGSSTPSILSPFESQAHHQLFYQFIFDSCHVKKTKKQKEAGIGPFLRQLVDKFISMGTQAMGKCKNDLRKVSFIAKQFYFVILVVKFLCHCCGFLSKRNTNSKIERPFLLNQPISVLLDESLPTRTFTVKRSTTRNGL